MKFQCLVGGLCMLASLCSYADDWSVTPLHSVSDNMTSPLMPNAMHVLSTLNVPDALYAIMFQDGVQASLAQDNWLSSVVEVRSGLVIQRQEGALYFQYRF